MGITLAACWRPFIKVSFVLFYFVPPKNFIHVHKWMLVTLLACMNS